MCKEKRFYVTTKQLQKYYDFKQKEFKSDKDFISKINEVLLENCGKAQNHFFTKLKTFILNKSK